MAQTVRNFFGRSWIEKVIEFEAADIFSAKKWKIVSKLNEGYFQEDEEGWEEWERELMGAWALFECVNPMDASETAFMRIHMLIPYMGSEFDTPQNRAEQAVPDFEWLQFISTASQLEREKQNDSGLVPGGYIVYLVTGKLPGILLSREDFWKHSREERDEIRGAFRVAYEDCVRAGIVPCNSMLGFGLLWDEPTKKIFMLGIRGCCRREKTWGNNIWLAYGLASIERCWNQGFQIYWKMEASMRHYGSYE